MLYFYDVNVVDLDSIFLMVDLLGYIMISVVINLFFDWVYDWLLCILYYEIVIYEVYVKGMI